MKNLFLKLFLFTAVVSLVACSETLEYDKHNTNPPTIESFSPAAAPVGSIIKIYGENLHNVTSVTIGGQEVEITEKISITEMNVKATVEGRSGVIAVKNQYGAASSETNFTYTYVVPEITISDETKDAEMSADYMINGKNLNAVTTVIFTPDGASEGREAAIITREDYEMVVRVPYVETNEANITFRYFDGTNIVETSKTDANEVNIIRYVPQITAEDYGRVAVGKLVTLTGENLNKIDSVTIDGYRANLSAREPERYQFTVPAGDFPDGESTREIVVHYFDGYENQTLGNLLVYVPFVKYWEGIKTYAQGRDVEEFKSFFSPETGIAYENSRWREEVDPISFKYQKATGSAPNVPAVTEAEYNSVNPYFFISGLSAGTLNLNSPANSVGQLKNFYVINNSANDNRVTGANADCYGTPVLTWRMLSESNPAEKEIIDMVRNEQIEYIDAQTFPIDLDAKTIRGISMNSAKGALTSDDYAPGVFTVGQNKDNVSLDAVAMIMYHDVKGAPSGTGVPPNVANIKRIGFIHITHINYRLYNNTNAPSTSDMTYNVYWQKYDYVYPKN